MNLIETVQDALFYYTAQINHFDIDIPCKIIKSFNGDESKQLNKKFKEYKDKKFLLKLLLLNTDEKEIYDYFYCNKNCNTNDLVIFYNIERLNLFINILNSNGFAFTKEEILEIPCTYSHKRPIIETLIIAMLYGNILPCHSSYTEKPFSIDDPAFTKTHELLALQTSYKSYIEISSNMTVTRTDNYVTINNIEREKNIHLKKNQNERDRHSYIRQQISSIKQKINNSTESTISKINKQKKLNKAVQIELYKKYYS